MEPVTATLETAKEVYDAVKKIEKVYNVSKEMKTVAESEGKDQIEATKNLAGTVASEMKQDSGTEKSESKGQDSETEKSESKSNNKSNDIGTKGDLHHVNQTEASSQKGNFVDEFRPVFHEGNVSTEPTDFVEKLPVKEMSKPVQFESDVFVDKLPSKENVIDSLFISQNNGEINAPSEVKERDPNHFSEKNQYVNSEKCKEYRSNPENEPLIEGCEKDPNILRHNMELVMGEDASEVNKSNSRAHHIVGDNEYSSESKAILDKYGIDINSPENGIFLPQDETSDLHGTIHDGKHTKAYNDEVTQRLRAATCKEDVLEILDSIKEDLYNGEMELYNEHKYNN